jgi:hypothetical protein
MAPTDAARPAALAGGSHRDRSPRLGDDARRRVTLAAVVERLVDMLDWNDADKRGARASVALVVSGSARSQWAGMRAGGCTLRLELTGRGVAPGSCPPKHSEVLGRSIPSSPVWARWVVALLLPLLPLRERRAQAQEARRGARGAGRGGAAVMPVAQGQRSSVRSGMRSSVCV